MSKLDQLIEKREIEPLDTQDDVPVHTIKYNMIKRFIDDLKSLQEPPKPMKQSNLMKEINTRLDALNN